nr:hypothetical protein [uncultured Capnocytophaga sp.]
MTYQSVKYKIIDKGHEREEKHQRKSCKLVLVGAYFLGEDVSQALLH